MNKIIWVFYVRELIVHSLFEAVSVFLAVKINFRTFLTLYNLLDPLQISMERVLVLLNRMTIVRLLT